MGTAKRIAGENGAVESRAGERLQRHGVGETGSGGADRAGDFPGRCAQRREGDGEFHQAATAERVAEAAFPRNERRPGKLSRRDLGLESARL